MAIDTKRINGKACVSTSLLCEFFGVSKQAVNKWEKQGCPKEMRGYWCMADVLKWKGDTAAEAGEALEEMSLRDQKTYWETRCKEEQAENQKFKNAVLRGDYIEKKEMDHELTTFFIVFKQAVLSLPRKIAILSAGYIGNDRARKLEWDVMEAVTDVLRQWSRGEVSMDTVQHESTQTTGKNHGQRVGRSKSNSRRKKQQ